MTSRELDEIMLLHWPRILRRAMAEGDDWTRSFVRSIARAYKRADWMPTPRQEFFMRRLLREMRSRDDLGDIIEEVRGDEAA